MDGENNVVEVIKKEGEEEKNVSTVSMDIRSVPIGGGQWRGHDDLAEAEGGGQGGQRPYLPDCSADEDNDVRSCRRGGGK